VKLSLDATPTRTTCPYCGVGCGVLAAQGKDGAVEVAGDPDHPANFGRLCSKGAALGETVGSEGRLTEPMVDGAPTNWPAALDRVATGFARAIADYGPDSVAFYVSGQMLTEDYYVINKLAKGFLGTANIDTNSRLCMASSVAGHKRAFGGDIVPGCYEDLDEADLLVLVGSNAAWCHPVLYQRMAAAKAARPSLRVVVIDPRRTDTCDLADLHLSLRPGSDAVLFNGLLSHLSKSGAAEATFVALHTKGADETLAAVNRQTPERTAEICGLAEGAVHLFFDWFAKTQKVVTLYSQGINQSSSGVDKVNSIINCHLLTGRIGRPGMGPFSLTGQPNAMGGREVGGLANQLAAHMEIDNPQHRDSVQRFWRSPAMASKPGLKAVDMFEAIGKGRIKAIWIMATNPLVSLPDVNGARAALEACPLVVVSDCMRHTDTTRVAHVLLPATTWGEKDGTVTNCERRISRQRRFLRAPGMARDDWRIVCDVAIRMGFAGFGYDSAAAIFREHAALSGFENDGSRGFDISSLSDVSGNRYDSLAPLQWPAPPENPAGAKRLFASGRFYARDGRARMVPILPRAPLHPTTPAFPLVLNSGRVRDHWHTMTRTGKSPRLSTHAFEPYAELHPDDARRTGLVDGGLARLRNDLGSMIARVRVSSEQRRGCVFAPMHWNSEFAGKALLNLLVYPAVDPISGQPESKHAPIVAEPYIARWHAFALTRQKIAPPQDGYWVEGRANEHWRQEFAGDAIPDDWDEWARKRLGARAGAEWMAYSDHSAKRHRFATIRNGRLEGCIFVAPDHQLGSRMWLAGLFAEPALSSEDRLALLAGRPRDSRSELGPVICSCFAVGRNQIAAAVEAGADSVAAIGALLKAGTNCGSCKPEINKLLRSNRPIALVG
jgi:assimilatory nitrate reductase catalytic subunit